jgi:hypothetical protein
VDKFCVFCGEKPESKTNEHILPLWLIELTGDPSRQVVLGHKKVVGMPERKFSFNSFKFPSCDACNSNFSNLENQTKDIMLKMLSDETLSQHALNTLLNWFDKIRVGLWLAYFYLDKNFAGITPSYYITKRIGVHDRMLAVFKAELGEKRLNFGGCETPFYYYTPSCFTLVVNHLYFLNISFPYLFARRIGFPFPSASYLLRGENNPAYTIEEARQRVMLPLLRKRFRLRGTEFYQPMFKYPTVPGLITKYYDIKYVRDGSLDYANGVGAVFIQRENLLQQLNEQPIADWSPQTEYPLDVIKRDFSILVFEWQDEINKLQPSTHNLSSDERRGISELQSFFRRFNKTMIHRLMQENL